MSTARGRAAWLVLVLAVLLVAYACSESAKKKHDPDDPFDDAYFHNDEWSSIEDDPFLKQGAPTVGSLIGPEEDSEHADAERRALEEAGFASKDSDPDSQDADSPKHEKKFSDRAQEATLATMSILVGLGMTALPFLVPGL
jgi:hypothetical protein